MLQIIDQRWRDHLSEMDYLREGINLRAMGQQDPLVAWQREGYEMFGQLMDGIDDDYLATSCHVQVLDRAGRRARPGPGQLPGRRRPGAGRRRHLARRWPPAAPAEIEQAADGLGPGRRQRVRRPG